jgi:hypothetical protein
MSQPPRLGLSPLCTPLHVTNCTSRRLSPGRYASSNITNRHGKHLWMLTEPKENRGKVNKEFWKQITEVNRECGLEALQALLGVLPTGASNPTIDNIVATITDPVFVSIDTEALDRGESRSEKVLGITELGISILDTRKLQETLTDDLSNVLSTFHYETEKCRQDYNPRYWPTFFGQSQYLDEHRTGWLVDHVLRTGSTDPSATEVRNTVLVGHAVCPDVFKLMKVGKLDLRNFPKLLILDTEIIAEPRLGLSQRLKHLLSYYNLPCHDLHNAANDAHFTLKLLLMLAVDNDSTMGWTLEGRAKLLKDIARAPTSRIPRHLAQMEVELLVEGYTGLSTTSG